MTDSVYKKTKTKGGATRYVPVENTTKAREAFRDMLKKAQSDSPLNGLQTRQPNQEDLKFTKEDYTHHNLIVPPYNPAKLYEIVESGGKLSTCIEVYVTSIEGYGYEFRYIGTRGKEESQEVQNEKETLEGFFARVNETQSTTKLRQELRRDFEATGNTYVEGLRYKDGDIAALYRADARYVRLQAKQKDPVPIKVSLMRNGKMRETTIYKRFRRFAMLIGGTLKIKFFKEFGDPRKMCAITGKYENELGAGEKIQEEATELLHIKQGNDIYGIPRWAGLASVVLGINSADYVNYNLFENNAIPALAILVSGGRLTSESIIDIANILKSNVNKENYTNVAILEALGADADGNVDDKSSTAKVDFKELNKPDDSLFQNYVAQCEKRIMGAFRLPPLLFGEVSDYSRNTSSNSKLLTEDAVFSVERRNFDEIFNFTVLPELGVKYHRLFTVGPRLLEGSDLIDAIGKLARAGALSVNQAVRLSNRILDLDTTPYDGDWANIPVALLLELLKKEKVQAIEDVGLTSTEDIAEANNAVEKLAGKSEMDSIAEDLSELKDQLEEVYSMVSSRI